MFRLETGQPPIDWIELVTTRICNAPFVNPGPTLTDKPDSCIYCYQKADQPLTKEEILEAKGNQLTTEEIFNLIDQASSLGIRRFYFLGGEPLLKQDIGEILDYASGKIDYTVISTNGTGVAKNLESLAKLSCVEVSIDSHIEEVACRTRPLYLVKKAQEALNLLLDRGIYTCVNAVLTPANLEIILDSIENWFQRGVRIVNLYPVIGEGHDGLTLTQEELFKIGQEIMAKYQTFLQTWCKAGRHINVMADGNINPCASFIGDELVIGDIRANLLSEILQAPILRKLQEYQFKRPSELGDYHPSKNCPAFKLYKNNWQESEILEEKGAAEEEKEEEKFCLRCNHSNSQEDTECGHCHFDKFSSQPIQPACHAFVVYSPEVI